MSRPTNNRQPTTKKSRRLRAARSRYLEGGLTRLSGFIALLVWFALVFTLVTVRQPFLDWRALRNYTPPAPVAAMANQDTMTDYARHVFYVNHPDLAAKEDFAKDCPNNGGEQTIILGCYHGDQDGIFVLQVSDTRLNGVEQVTAAHEMLHAAYDRLGNSEKSRVDAMLTDYYNNHLTDERVKTTIDAYKKSEPTELVNEMHSIFGTEVANLPAPLEAYYRKYFANRNAVVGFAAAYQSEFTNRQTAIAADDKQLASLRAQITANNSELQGKLAAVSSKRQTLLGLRESNPDAYNAQVPSYNALIDSYNREVEATQILVTQYNQIVTARNAIVFEQQQLSGELNASATPINQ